MSDSPTEKEVEKPSVETTDTTGAKADSPPANETDKGVNADSPPAEDKGAKKSLADHIHAVVNKPTEASPPAKTDDPNTKTEQQGDGDKPLTEAEAPELSKEEMGQLNVKTARRMRYLTDSLASTRTELNATVPEAKEYRKLKGFLAENGVSGQDANKAIQLAAAIINDPESALAEIEPIVQALREKTGAVLPADLAEQVKNGYITEAVAKETAVLRARTKFREERDERATKEAEAAAATTATKTTSSIMEAVTGWERSWAANDADYPKLCDDVDDAINGELRRRKAAGTLPKTPKEAVDMAKECLAKVKARNARQPVEEIKHISGKSSASTEKKPRAASLAEHLLQQGI